MSKIEKICTLLGITKKTWYNWKDEERLITMFIEKYLSSERIDEFIETRTIKSFDKLKLLDELEKEVFDLIQSFDYFQRKVLITILNEYKADKTDFALEEYVEYVGLGKFIKDINYLPDEVSDKESLLFQKCNTLEYKHLQANILKESIFKLNSYQLVFLYENYEEIVYVDKEFIKLPKNKI